MPLRLLPAGVADFPRAIAIETEAFGPNPTAAILFPGPFPGNEARCNLLAKQIREDSRCHCLKVVDEDLEERGEEPMIAFAQWYIWDPPPPTDYEPTVQWGPGSNPHACDHFFGAMRKKMKERFDGKPVAYLKLLHTQPKHQRRGAASLLLNWGIEESERRGIPAYLEATTEGYPVYEKFGFRRVETLVVNFAKWGGGSDEAALMLREPASSK